MRTIHCFQRGLRSILLIGVTHGVSSETARTIAEHAIRLQGQLNSELVPV